MRCDEEKEQENDSGREPDEEPCAPCTRRATEFLGDHSGALLGPPLVRFRYGYSSPKLREHKGRSTPGAERSFIKTFDPPEGSARGHPRFPPTLRRTRRPEPRDEGHDAHSPRPSAASDGSDPVSRLGTEAISIAYGGYGVGGLLKKNGSLLQKRGARKKPVAHDACEHAQEWVMPLRDLPSLRVRNRYTLPETTIALKRQAAVSMQPVPRERIDTSLRGIQWPKQLIGLPLEAACKACAQTEGTEK